ncbi:MAG: hypothetical protein NT069_35060 [Planctomycetota bacterium]|nr:hypothetical protein [Planctomycetota bacterium]
MNETSHPSDWEQRLRAGLGEPPIPDFADWSEKHPEALAALKPALVTPTPHRATSPTPPVRKKLMQPWKWLAASALIACGLLWFWPGGNLDRSAFAGTIPGVDDVQGISWTSTYYLRITSADGKRTWLRQEERRHAYRHPGLYRDTILDEAGTPRAVEITDARAGKMLRLDLVAKTAVLSGPVGRPDVRGPFAWVGDALRERMVGKTLPVKSVALKGQRSVDGHSANIVRAFISKGDDQGYMRHDFLFDAESKQLVGLFSPNDGNFDPETAADRENPAEKEWSTMFAMAALEHQIVLNPKLELADFSIDPPAGYSFEKKPQPTLSEAEMIAYLGAAARFNDNQFPDSPFVAFDSEKFNAACLKEAASQTAAEQELIALHDQFKLREIYRSPVRQFVDDHAVENSFHYVGAEVKVGEADRIVAWYKPRGGKSFRAIFGGLSVKEVSEKDLPLNLSN